MLLCVHGQFPEMPDDPESQLDFMTTQTIQTLSNDYLRQINVYEEIINIENRIRENKFNL